MIGAIVLKVFFLFLFTRMHRKWSFYTVAAWIASLSSSNQSKKKERKKLRNPIELADIYTNKYTQVRRRDSAKSTAFA